MSRVDIAEFSDKDIFRIFIAGSIGEAEHAEALLTENAISYALQIKEFGNPGFFISSVKEGVVFYVLSGQRHFCRQLSLANGLKTGLINSEDWKAFG